ncbi:MAG: fumarylacetoacetate hydrolase family protein [Burkholderiales bacterium]|nr:fumarylacetoacetate hydrolase family protein [Burkholderiales bacterium]
MTDIHKLAGTIDGAARDARAIAQLSAGTTLTLEQAYAIQKASIDLRLTRGERRVGVKMGFTNRAKAVQMGVHDIVCGRLTDRMIIEDGGTVDFARYVHPRIEPEIAFLLKAPLEGVVTPAQALAAVEAIAPAMELIDSRYENFKFSLEDVVADNASSSGFVVGAWHRPDIDCSNLGIVLSFDGRPVQIGSSAAILGHPLRSLVAAARMTAAGGERLEPGWIVLAGSATAAEPLRRGLYVEAEVQSLGRVAFTIGN